MKLRPNSKQQNFEGVDPNKKIWEHPWNTHLKKWDAEQAIKNGELIKPNPPTTEAVKKAEFVDKTYQWQKK